MFPSFFRLPPTLVRKKRTAVQQAPPTPVFSTTGLSPASVGLLDVGAPPRTPAFSSGSGFSQGQAPQELLDLLGSPETTTLPVASPTIQRLLDFLGSPPAASPFPRLLPPVTPPSGGVVGGGEADRVVVGGGKTVGGGSKRGASGGGIPAIDLDTPSPTGVLTKKHFGGSRKLANLLRSARKGKLTEDDLLFLQLALADAAQEAAATTVDPVTRQSTASFSPEFLFLQQFVQEIFNAQNVASLAALFGVDIGKLAGLDPDQALQVLQLMEARRGRLEGVPPFRAPGSTLQVQPLPLEF